MGTATNYGTLTAALASRTSSAIESLRTDAVIPVTESYQEVKRNSAVRRRKEYGPRRRPWHLRRVGTTGGKTYQPNGPREIARRLRQDAKIAAGGGRIARRRRERAAETAEFEAAWDAMMERLAGRLGESLCIECGIFRADPPFHLCPGCEAYQAHRQ